MNQRAAPYVLAPGQARSHPGAVHTVKAGAADTGGLFTFCEDVMAPRTPGPPLHVHDEEDECFYLIEGHLLVQVGEERHDLGPGCFAWLPRQVPHAFANVSDSPVHPGRRDRARRDGGGLRRAGRLLRPAAGTTGPGADRGHLGRPRPPGPPGRPADRSRRRACGEPVLTCRAHGQRPGALPGPRIAGARPPWSHLRFPAAPCPRPAAP